MSDINIEYKRECSWNSMSDDTKAAVYAHAEGYMKFLDAAKTERESVDVLIEGAKSAGFIDFEEIIKSGKKLSAGDKIYWNNRGKACMLAIIGKENPVNGINMVGAHVDAPRFDFKPNPIYEDKDFCYAKTHYYGGIKKYQWVAIPLAIHGVIRDNDGKWIKISIGEDEEDPCFVITDLLPHLAYEQVDRKASDVMIAENMNLLLGSIPYTVGDEDKKSVKTAILTLLNEKYGITEKSFNFAELQIVPAFKARHIGFDRSLIGAYAQDDRVCSYAAYKALIDLNEIPEKTAACYFSDREEIGSVGNTGARANWLENFTLELCNATGNGDMVSCRRLMRNTRFLSADVTAGFDPLYADVYDTLNVAYLGKGIALEKYTGHRGKSSASEASCEFIEDVTNAFDKENIPWQITEMGKQDKGGGGTIAQYMTDLGMDVVDCGVPVLSMHAPFEVTSKADVYWTYRAYKAFIS